jgi:hypothetical protein
MLGAPSTLILGWLVITPLAATSLSHMGLMVDYRTKAAQFQKCYSQAARDRCCRCSLPMNGIAATVVASMSKNDGDEFQAECAHMLMKRIYTPACHPYSHPAANGAVGGLVWSVEDILRKYIKAHLQYWVSQEAPSLHGSYVALAFSSGVNLPLKLNMSALTWLCQMGSNISC